MSLTVVYYLDVISSWCHWAEPAYAELKRRYAERVRFEWRIALIGPAGMPVSPAQDEWFYRRSGTVTRSPYMLNTGWLEPGLTEYLAPNCVAVAASDLGVTDDRVRLALAHAAVREGRRIGRWEESVAVASAAGGLDAERLFRQARAPETERRIRQTTQEFESFQIDQRPAFVLTSGIGDRAVLSGFWRLDPLVAVVDSMLADATAYASWKAHFGDPPAA
jgi:predicted DsbA family dithiol-disulfide isomerase